MNVVVLPRDDVAGARDADNDLVVLVLDLARGENLKQLGVQRTPVKLKDQIADRRSDKRKSHDTQAQPYARTCLLLWRIIGRATPRHKHTCRLAILLPAPRWGEG